MQQYKMTRREKNGKVDYILYRRRFFLFWNVVAINEDFATLKMIYISHLRHELKRKARTTETEVVLPTVYLFNDGSEAGNG